MTFIVTHSGRLFDYTGIESNEIYLPDVVWSLSRQYRYNGHTHRPISVAEHTIRAYEFALRLGYEERLVKIALLHDAPEAYVGDMPGPLKPFVPQFVEIEDRIMRHMLKQFGIGPLSETDELLVKQVDELALWFETRGEPINEPEKRLRSLYDHYFNN